MQYIALVLFVSLLVVSVVGAACWYVFKNGKIKNAKGNDGLNTIPLENRTEIQETPQFDKGIPSQTHARTQKISQTRAFTEKTIVDGNKPTFVPFHEDRKGIQMVERPAPHRGLRSEQPIRGVEEPRGRIRMVPEHHPAAKKPSKK